MARDAVGYSICKESKDNILSLLHFSGAENLNIIFPLLLKDGTQYVYVLKERKPPVDLRSCCEMTGDCNDKMYFLQINSEFILTFQPLLFQLVLKESWVGCTDEEGLFFEEILKKLEHYYHTNQGSLISRFYLSIFLQCFYEILIREKGFKFREEALAKNFLKMLQTDNNHVRQVQYYAEKLFVCRRYLTKAVSNTFGQTPKSFIDIRIVNEAKKLLATQMTVYEISEHLKFESSGSFTVFFKKHTNYTPTEYRQKKLNI